MQPDTSSPIRTTDPAIPEVQFTSDQWRELLQATSDFVAVCSPLGEIVYANRPSVLGTQASIGSRLIDVVSETQRHEFAALIHQVRETGRSESGLYRIHGSSPGVNLHCTLSVLPGSEVPSVVLVGRDPTGQSECASTARQSDQRIQVAQFHDSLAQLAGGLSHDFNNLLGAILANIWYVAHELPKDSPHRIALDEAQSAMDHAATLCRELQAYAGQTSGSPGRLNPHTLLADMSRLLYTSVSKKATLSITCSDADAMVHGNANQLRQLIAILVTNASESLQGASGQIRVEMSARHLSREDLSHSMVDTTLQPGEYTVIEVTDSGQGMNEAILCRAIEPFFTTRSGKRGLGLAAANGIIRAHGGTLLARSEPGVGSRISAALPIAHRAHEPPSNPSAPATKSVLIADDEIWMRSACKRILQQDGYEVIEASDGRQAVDILRRQDRGIGCVLMDLSMPELNGREAIQLMRATHPSIPIVLMTGATDPRPDGTDCCDFLSKPFLPESLLQMVGSAWGPRPTALVHDDP